jgi:hypothetical protein
VLFVRRRNSLASVMARLTVGVTSLIHVEISPLGNVRRVWIGVANISLSAGSRVLAFS